MEIRTRYGRSLSSDQRRIEPCPHGNPVSRRSRRAISQTRARRAQYLAMVPSGPRNEALRVVQLVLATPHTHQRSETLARMIDSDGPVNTDHQMSNERIILLIIAVIGLLLIVMLEDRSACKDALGDPCKFGGSTHYLQVEEIKEVSRSMSATPEPGRSRR